MKDFTSWCVHLLSFAAEVSGKGNTLVLRYWLGELSWCLSSSSASLLPPLSRGRVGKMDTAWHSCAGRCWSSEEGFEKAWEMGESLSITKCDDIGELQLETISVEKRFGMAQSTNSRGVTCIGLGRGETEKWGIKWTRNCWFRRKHFMLKSPMIPLSTFPLCRVSRLKIPGGSARGEAKPNVVHYRREGVIPKCAT